MAFAYSPLPHVPIPLFTRSLHSYHFLAIVFFVERGESESKREEPEGAILVTKKRGRSAYADVDSDQGQKHFMNPVALQSFCCKDGSLLNFQGLRSYARGGPKKYDLFGSGIPGSKEFREAWSKEMEEDNTLWTGSEDESDEEKYSESRLKKEIRKVRQQAKEQSDLIDADDSGELTSVWSDSDEEKTLWTGDEMDSDDDIPTEHYPNESSDKYIDKLSDHLRVTEI